MSNLDKVRSEMNAYRASACDLAGSLKDSQVVTEKLRAYYERLSLEQKQLADQILCEWALSQDEKMRFDALALIDEFGVKAAWESLHNIEARLASHREPSVPYELKKIRRIIERLQS